MSINFNQWKDKRRCSELIDELRKETNEVFKMSIHNSNLVIAQENNCDSSLSQMSSLINDNTRYCSTVYDLPKTIYELGCMLRQVKHNVSERKSTTAPFD